MRTGMTKIGFGLVAFAVLCAAGYCLFSFGLAPETLEGDISYMPCLRTVRMNTERAYGSVAYEKTGLKPGSYYELSILCDLSQTVVEDEREPVICLTVSRDQDYNGEAAAACLTKEAYDAADQRTVRLTRIAKANAHGQIAFGVQAGSEENRISGETSIRQVMVNEANTGSGYEMICSRDESVRLLLRTADAERIDRKLVADWLEIMAQFRADLEKMTGRYMPDGASIDYVATGAMAYYGLAGDPIYMHADYVQDDLNSICLSDISGECNVLWTYVHEMSHVFDGIGPDSGKADWNFDREFFADLKMACLFEKYGYVMRPGQQNVLEEFEQLDTLGQGMYSSRGFVYTLLTALKSFDAQTFEHLSRVFRAFDKMENVPETDSEKFLEFMCLLSEELGTDVFDLMDSRCVQTLMQYYQ